MSKPAEDLPVNLVPEDATRDGYLFRATARNMRRPEMDHRPRRGARWRDCETHLTIGYPHPPRRSRPSRYEASPEADPRPRCASILMNGRRSYEGHADWFEKIGATVPECTAPPAPAPSRIAEGGGGGHTSGVCQTDDGSFDRFN